MRERESSPRAFGRPYGIDPPRPANIIGPLEVLAAAPAALGLCGAIRAGWGWRRRPARKTRLAAVALGCATPLIASGALAALVYTSSIGLVLLAYAASWAAAIASVVLGTIASTGFANS